MRARKALAAITLPLLAYFLTVLSLGFFWSSVEDLYPAPPAEYF